MIAVIFLSLCPFTIKAEMLNPHFPQDSSEF